MIGDEKPVENFGPFSLDISMVFLDDMITCPRSVIFS